MEEQQFFISVLRDYLLEENTKVSDSLDWDIIKEFAESHQLSGVFYYQTRQQIFQNSFAFQICRFANFKQSISIFKEALKDYAYIMVKGAIIAELYPVPDLRSMGDVDILIHVDDRAAVHQALLSAGFKFLSDGEDLGEWKYSINGFLFEVHDSLVHRYEGKENLVDYFSNAWTYIEGNQLNWSFHLIYLIEHLRQHFVGEGVGFRQFMDVAIVSKKCDIDWNFVSCELGKINLYNFATVIFAFIKIWFEIEVPFETAKISEAFYVQATQKIFNDGVFGISNEDNLGKDLSFLMHYKEIDLKTAKKQYIFQRLFPSYKEMCYLPYCRYVKLSRILLPLAWIHRIIYRLFDRSSRDNMKMQLSSEGVLSRIEMLKKWGL